MSIGLFTKLCSSLSLPFSLIHIDNYDLNIWMWCSHELDLQICWIKGEPTSLKTYPHQTKAFKPFSQIASRIAHVLAHELKDSEFQVHSLLWYLLRNIGEIRIMNALNYELAECIQCQCQWRSFNMNERNFLCVSKTWKSLKRRFQFDCVHFTDTRLKSITWWLTNVDWFIFLLWSMETVLQMFHIPFTQVSMMLLPR